MEQIALENIEFLAKRSLEDLHHSSRQWLFNIEFWRKELSFFQKLLDSQAKNAKSLEKKKMVDHFQNLITYYQGELLDEFHQKVRRYEKILRKQINGDTEDNNNSFREMYNVLFDQIMSFENQFKEHKLNFYDFMNGFIDNK